MEKKRKLSLLNQYGDLTKCACFCGEPITFFSKPILGDGLVVSRFSFLLFFVLVNTI